MSKTRSGHWYMGYASSGELCECDDMTEEEARQEAYEIIMSTLSPEDISIVWKMGPLFEQGRPGGKVVEGERGNDPVSRTSAKTKGKGRC